MLASGNVMNPALAVSISPFFTVQVTGSRQLRLKPREEGVPTGAPWLAGVGTADGDEPPPGRGLAEAVDVGLNLAAGADVFVHATSRIAMTARTALMSH